MKNIQFILFAVLLMVGQSVYAVQPEGQNVQSFVQQLNSGDDKEIKKAVRSMYNKRIVEAPIKDTVNTLLEEYLEKGNRKKKVAQLLIKYQMLDIRTQDIPVIKAIFDKHEGVREVAALYLMESEAITYRKKYFSEALKSRKEEANIASMFVATLWGDAPNIVERGARRLYSMGLLKAKTLDSIYEAASFRLEQIRKYGNTTYQESLRVMLMTLANTGNKKYLEIIDEADKAIKAERFTNKMISARERINQRADLPSFHSQAELVAYMKKGIAIENDEDKRLAIIKFLYLSGIRDKALWDEVNTQLKEFLKQDDDLASWWVKSLATSGHLEYKSSFDSIRIRPKRRVDYKAGEAVEGIDPKIGRHIRDAVSKIFPYQKWYEMIERIRGDASLGTDEERVYLMLAASPNWRDKFIATSWMKKTHYNESKGLALIVENMNNLYKNSPNMGDKDIVMAAHFSDILAHHGTQSEVEVLQGIIDSNVNHDVKDILDNAIRHIEKRVQ